MKDTYVFPAIFIYQPEGISVQFPDLPGCLTCGDHDADAMQMAQEALEGVLAVMETHGLPIPVPTPASKIPVEKNEAIVLIRANMRVVRTANSNRSVRKTLTIPLWLNEQAEAAGVNFSQVLQVALKEVLGKTEATPRKKSA